MTARDELAHRFADAMGWHVHPYFDRNDPRTPVGARCRPEFESVKPPRVGGLQLPDVDFPLGDHLAFVARVADALYPDDRRGQIEWVAYAITYRAVDMQGADPSMLAMQAAIDEMTERRPN